MLKLSFFAAAVALLLCAIPASAQNHPTFAAVTCATRSEHEGRDRRAVDAATRAYLRDGYAAIGRHVSALERVMSHAPDCFPMIEARDGQILVRAQDREEFLMVSAILQQATPGVSIQRDEVNIYVGASFLLGAYAVETHRFEEAIAWLDRGLALQPRYQPLLLERVVALMWLDRYAEAYAMLRSALDDPEHALTLDRSRFLRDAGVALIGLERLDEAEAVLNEALQLRPSDQRTRDELNNIARQRAGGERSNVGEDAAAPTK